MDLYAQKKDLLVQLLHPATIIRVVKRSKEGAWYDSEIGRAFIAYGYFTKNKLYVIEYGNNFAELALVDIEDMEVIHGSIDLLPTFKKK